MAARAKKHSTIAPSGSRTHLRDVPLGSFARLLDGSIVRIAAIINGAIFIRDEHQVALAGPYEMPGETVVLEVIAPDVNYADRAAVADPVSS